MIIDTLTLRVLACELDASWRGQRLRAAVADAEALTLQVAGAEPGLRLEFGPPGRLRLVPSDPVDPPADGDARYLAGARVARIAPAEAQRLLCLRLERADADGRPTFGTLFLSLAPPRFRAALVGERHGRILGAWAGDGDRRAWRRGAEGPVGGDDPVVTPDRWTAADLATILEGQAERVLAEALRRAGCGLDRHLAAGLCVAADVDPAAPASSCDAAARDALLTAAQRLWHSAGPRAYRWSVGAGVERVSVLAPIGEPTGDGWPSVGAALAAPEAAPPAAVAAAQRAVLRRGLETLRRRERAVAADLDEAGEADRLQGLGEALLAAPGRLPTGGSGEVPDARDPEPTAAHRVALAPGETQAAHAARLLKRAARLRRRLDVLPARLRRVRELLRETDNLLARLAPTAPALREDEMAQWQRRTGLRAAPGEPTGGRRREARDDDRHGARPRRYRTSSGWSVWAGRSNRENDVLTHKIAAQNDVWFHAHGYAGSHVILRREGRKEEPSARALEEAAAVAAYWSKGRTANKVPVVYTLAKYVSKPRGGPPGLAVMKREKTIMVRPALLDAEDEEEAA